MCKRCFGSVMSTKETSCLIDSSGQDFSFLEMTERGKLFFPVSNHSSHIVFTISLGFYYHIGIDDVSLVFTVFFYLTDARNWKRRNDDIRSIVRSTSSGNMSISSLCVEIQPRCVEFLFEFRRISGKYVYFPHKNGGFGYLSSVECDSAIRKIIFYCKNSSSKIFLPCKPIFYSCSIPVHKTSDIGITDIFHEFELFSLDVCYDDLMSRDKWCWNRISEKCEHSHHPDRKYRHTDDQFDESESLFRDERGVRE